jgi:hypothetical protein
LAPYCIGLDRSGSSCSCIRYVLERCVAPVRPGAEALLLPMRGEVSDVVMTY